MTIGSQSTITAQQQMIALAETAALGMIQVLAVGGMGSMASAAMAAAGTSGVSRASSIQSAEYRLGELDEKIRKLGFVLDRYKSSVVSLRHRRSELMQFYGLSVIPPLSQMGKYPQLKAVEKNLKLAEENLARLEVRDMNLRRERNKILAGMGRKAEEPPAHVQYTQTKKFVKSTGGIY